MVTLYHIKEIKQEFGPLKVAFGEGPNSLAVSLYWPVHFQQVKNAGSEQ
jgi:hypothetical protein